jgi:hypothetical protein
MWKRRPYVKDLELVRAAIQEAGLPVTDPVLDFHRTFAGYMTDVWGDEGPLGIIHPEVVAIESWFQPMKLGGYLTAREPLLACADIHMSWEMMIALDGTFYCNAPQSSSYFLWTEQCAFQHEFFETRKARVLKTAAARGWLAEVFLPRLAGCRIDALSDEYGQVYATDQFVVSVGQQGQRYHVLVAEGVLPAQLADFQRPR